MVAGEVFRHVVDHIMRRIYPAPDERVAGTIPEVVAHFQFKKNLCAGCVELRNQFFQHSLVVGRSEEFAVVFDIDGVYAEHGEPFCEFVRNAGKKVQAGAFEEYPGDAFAAQGVFEFIGAASGFPGCVRQHPPRDVSVQKLRRRTT